MVVSVSSRQKTMFNVVGRVAGKNPRGCLKSARYYRFTLRLFVHTAVKNCIALRAAHNTVAAQGVKMGHLEPNASMCNCCCASRLASDALSYGTKAVYAFLKYKHFHRHNSSIRI